MSIFKEAFNKGVEVLIAKSKADLFRDGIHTLNPSLIELEGCLKDSLILGIKLIVIHSEKTWAPYIINQTVNTLQH